MESISSMFKSLWIGVSRNNDAPIARASISSNERDTSFRPHFALSLPEIVASILEYSVSAADLPYLPHPSFGGERFPRRPDIFREQRSQWWFPLLVCKQWFMIGMSLKPKETNWVDNYGFLSDSLSGVELKETTHLYMRFTYFHHLDSDVVERLAERRDALHRLLKSMGNASTAGKAGDYGHPTKRPLPQLRELRMSGSCGASQMALALSVIPYFAHQITMLNLDFAPSGYPPQLDICALLRASDDYSSGPSTFKQLRHLSLSNISIPTVPTNFSLDFPSHLKTIRMTGIKSEMLDSRTLLFALCGPRLQALHLGSFPSPDRFRVYGVLSYSEVALLGTLSPNIITLVLHSNIRPSIEAITTLTSLFPKVRTIQLETSMLTITAIREHVMSALGSSSTDADTLQLPMAPPPHRLEIVRLDLNHIHFGNDAMWMSDLSDFLCSPASVHLRELIAPNVEYFQLYDTEDDSAIPSQWQCRHLEVLAIGFLRGMNQDNSFPLDSCDLYGMIVVQCPKLRYLELQTGCVDMLANNGFCLLARLANLEHLVLHGRYCTMLLAQRMDPKELSWMQESPSKWDSWMGRSNLAWCRRVVAKSKGCTHLLRANEGREKLWPTDGTSSADGALWIRLKSISIHLDDSQPVLFGEWLDNHKALMQHVFPDIEFAIHERCLRGEEDMWLKRARSSSGLLGS